MIIGSHPFLNSKRMYPIACLLNKHSLVDTRGEGIFVIRAQA